MAIGIINYSHIMYYIITYYLHIYALKFITFYIFSRLFYEGNNMNVNVSLPRCIIYLSFINQYKLLLYYVGY